MKMLVGGALIALMLCPAAAGALDMNWSDLPEPKRLRTVLDTEAFLGDRTARVVQVAALKTTQEANEVKAVIVRAGLHPAIRQEGRWFIVLLPETPRNRAETLRRWARREGFRDAFVTTNR